MRYNRHILNKDSVVLRAKFNSIYPCYKIAKGVFLLHIANAETQSKYMSLDC